MSFLVCGQASSGECALRKDSAVMMSGGEFIVWVDTSASLWEVRCA
jgi:hypothetical protein